VGLEISKTEVIPMILRTEVMDVNHPGGMITENLFCTSDFTCLGRWTAPVAYSSFASGSRVTDEQYPVNSIEWEAYHVDIGCLFFYLFKLPKAGANIMIAG